MPLVRATNSGAKTILAHFHYCYKGQQLFTQGFDWTAPKVRRMARLDAEQTNFMAQCRDVVVKKGKPYPSPSVTHDPPLTRGSPHVPNHQPERRVSRQVVVHEPAF
jgi:hypothetical protein